MDTQRLLPPPAKPQRRHHPLQFKEQVVAASRAPGASIAGVARHFDVNANLVHTWRKQLGNTAAPENTDFIKVSSLPKPSDQSASAIADAALKVDIASPMGVVTLHWPMDRLNDLAVWLKSS